MKKEGDSERAMRVLSRKELIMIFIFGLLLTSSSLHYLLTSKESYVPNQITGMAASSADESNSIFSLPYASEEESKNFVRWARLIIASLIFAIGLLILGSFIYGYRSARLEFERDILTWHYGGSIREAIRKARDDDYSDDMLRRMLVVRMDNVLKTRIRKGDSKETIRGALLDAGWPEKFIKMGLAKVAAKPIQRKRPSIEEFDNYIINALRKGYSADKLSVLLKKSGWPEELVDDRITKIKKVQAEAEAKAKEELKKQEIAEKELQAKSAPPPKKAVTKPKKKTVKKRPIKKKKLIKKKIRKGTKRRS
jgi:hypothetical protein